MLADWISLDGTPYIPLGDENVTFANGACMIQNKRLFSAGRCERKKLYAICQTMKLGRKYYCKENI